jgi:hypothetical protein
LGAAVAGRADLQFRSDLPGHEAVEHPAEEVSMAGS